MRILQICKKVPYPPIDGESIAILNLSKGYKALGHDVQLLCLNTDRHYCPSDILIENSKKIAVTYTVDISTKLSKIKAFKNLLMRRSYVVDRFISQKMREKLKSVLQKESFDIIQLEGIHVAPYVSLIRQCTAAKIILRAHNIEYQVWSRLAKGAYGIKKIYLKIEANLMRKIEKKYMCQVDGLAFISFEDKRIYESWGINVPACVIPASIRKEEIKPIEHVRKKKHLFFIGGLDYRPNKEGIDWFLKCVWQKIHQKDKDIWMYIAGRNVPPDMYQSKYTNVKVVGEIKDIDAFVKEQSIMLVPLLSGGGMRIKIIQSMAWGKPVISTTIGAEGILYQRDKHISIADSPEAFSLEVHRLLSDTALYVERAQEAQNFVDQRYNNTLLTQKMLLFMESVIDK